jgi:hypothetical protein
MNLIEMQYKADTGNSSTVDLEIEERNPSSLLRADYYKIEDMKTLEIFSVKYEDCIRLHTPEYVKWLEEKLETLQKST